VNTFKKKDIDMDRRESGRFSRSLIRVLSGDFLSKETVVGLLPFIFFLTFLGVMYIANGYYAQGIVRDLQKTGNDVKELRSEYITIKSDLNYKSKQSQVAKATGSIEVYESTIPPTKIVVDKEVFEKITIDN